MSRTTRKTLHSYGLYKKGTKGVHDLVADSSHMWCVPKWFRRIRNRKMRYKNKQLTYNGKDTLSKKNDIAWLWW